MIKETNRKHFFLIAKGKLTKKRVLYMTFYHKKINIIVCFESFFYLKALFHRILITLSQIIINYSIMANLNRIKVVLVEKGKTGKWLAEKVGKTPCTVSKWCSNSIQPDLQTLDKIAKILDVDVKDLLNSTK